MYIKVCRFFLLLFLLPNGLLSQGNPQHRIDSLSLFIKEHPGPDTTHVRSLLELSDVYRQTDLVKATEYCEKALKESKEIKYPFGIAKATHITGLIESAKGDFKKAKEDYNKALLLYQEMKSEKGIAQMYYHIAITEIYSADYTKATDYLFRSMRIYDKLKDTRRVADCCGALANIYGRQGNPVKEMEYQNKCLEAKISIDDKSGIAACYINIGNAYGRRDIYDTALIYYFKGLKLAREINNRKWVMNACGNIGTIYTQTGKMKEAQEYLQKTLELAQLIGDKQTLITTMNTLSTFYSKQKEFTKSKYYGEEALKIAIQTGNRNEVRTSYDNLSNSYAELGDYEIAYNYHRKYSDLQDSILNEENTKQISEVGAKYEVEKKDNEIKLLNKDKEIREANLQQQRFIIWFGAAGLFIVMTLAFFIFRQFRQKQKANIALGAAYHIIEEKNKDITDSINYARRIQTAILPSLEQISQHLPDSFILYQPKDIVSGDFYWFTEKDDLLLIAVADCTGHGVPGAFMSMIGNDLLTQIVIEKGITQPHSILTQLHDGVKTALKQDNSTNETKDGMDIAIAAIKKGKDELHISFAAALRPLWFIPKDKNEVEEIKGDKHSIGGSYDTDQRTFTKHELQLKKGDKLFLSTDGYADQFGGENGKKFMTRNMKDVLLSYGDLPMSEQEKKLKNAFQDWKGDRGQVDDILVIGIRA